MENNNFGEGLGIIIGFIIGFFLIINLFGFFWGTLQGGVDNCDSNVPYINFGYKFGCYFVGNDYPITK